MCHVQPQAKRGSGTMKSAEPNVLGPVVAGCNSGLRPAWYGLTEFLVSKDGFRGIRKDDCVGSTLVASVPVGGQARHSYSASRKLVYIPRTTLFIDA